MNGLLDGIGTELGTRLRATDLRRDIDGGFSNFHGTRV